jgi:hypothetical protein
MSWTTIEGEELSRLKRRVDESLGAKSRRLTALRMDLPFYLKGWLLRLENETGHGYAVETRDGTLVPLDGSVAQINFANEIAGLRLDIGNALAYAVFFARFLVDDTGDAFPFVMERGAWSLDTGRTPEDLTPCIKMARDGSGTFQINAYLSHGGGLFAALLEVRPDGAIAMVKDEPLGRIVSLQ